MRRALALLIAILSCAPSTRSSSPSPSPSPSPPSSSSSSPSPVAVGDGESARTLRDTNVPGTTLNPEAVFVDPKAPADWMQCAGFTNTAADDVLPTFLDNCLGARLLRVRVFTLDNKLEEDVFVSDISPTNEWPLSSVYLGRGGKVVKRTFWGSLEGGAQSLLFLGVRGSDACMKSVAPGGVTLGSGHANTAIIAGGATGYDEYRLSCGQKSLPDRKIAIYREASSEPLSLSSSSPIAAPPPAPEQPTRAAFGQPLDVGLYVFPDGLRLRVVQTAGCDFDTSVPCFGGTYRAEATFGKEELQVEWRTRAATVLKHQIEIIGFRRFIVRKQ